MEEKKRSYFNCSVSGCFNSTLNSELTFFKVPIVSERREKWLKLMHRDDLSDSISTRARVCEAHFISNSIIISRNRKLLKKNAIPQLLLSAPGYFANKGIQTIFETADANTQCYYGFQTNAQVQTPLHLLKDTPRNEKLLREIQTFRNRNKITSNTPSEANILLKTVPSHHHQATSSACSLSVDYNDEGNLASDTEMATADDSSSFYEDVHQSPGPRGAVHEGFQCDKCGNQIIGFRYVCLECIDFDLCSACESHGVHDEHYVLRIPAPRTQSEIQKVLRRIRNEIIEVITQMNNKSELRQKELDTLRIKVEEPEIKVELPEDVDPDPLEHAPAQIDTMGASQKLSHTDSIGHIYIEIQPQAPVKICRMTQDIYKPSDKCLVLQVNPISVNASQDVATVKTESDDFSPNTVDAVKIELEPNEIQPNEMELQKGLKRVKSKQTDKLKAKRSKVDTAESTSDKGCLSDVRKHKK